MIKHEQIPKIIHYCWFGPKPLGDLQIKCIKTWKKNFKNFEIIKWDESNSPMEHRFVKEAYGEGKYAFVADYVRLWALYQNGGIYLDTDMWMIKKMDKYLTYSCFFGYEDGNRINAAIIGSISKNEFIFNILKEYDNIEIKNKDLIEISIPRIITKTFSKYPHKEEIKIFPKDYFYPFPWDERVKGELNFRKFTTKNTVAVHLWDASWLSEYANYEKPTMNYLLHLYRLLKKTIKNLLLPK